MSDDSEFERFEKVLRANLPVVPARELEPGDRLADFGLDSLLLLQLVVQLEDAFTVDLPDEVLTATTFETVDSLWRGLSSAVEEDRGYG